MMTERKQRPIGTALLVFLLGYQWFYNGANFIAFKVGGDARFTRLCLPHCASA